MSSPTPKVDSTPSPSVTLSTPKQKETISNNLEDSNDSVDEDVDELLGKLEVSIYLCHQYTHTHTYTFIYTRLFIKTKKSPFLLTKYSFPLFSQNYLNLSSWCVRICM
jgi:hypothetical protein